MTRYPGRARPLAVAVSLVALLAVAGRADGQSKNPGWVQIKALRLSTKLLAAESPDEVLERVRKVRENEREVVYPLIQEEAARALAAGASGVREANARLILCGSESCTPWSERPQPPPPPSTDQPGTGNLPQESVRPPVKLSAPPPAYTPAARSARVEGSVVVLATIDRDGRVVGVEVLSGLPFGLSEAAAETVLGWTFRPAELDGEPVPVFYNLTVHFALTKD